MILLFSIQMNFILCARFYLHSHFVHHYHSYLVNHEQTIPFVVVMQANLYNYTPLSVYENCNDLYIPLKYQLVYAMNE